MKVHLGCILAVFCVAATASAKPAHVTVLDFEGPSRLADAARASVLTALANQYDIVSTKRWQAARMNTSSGPPNWAAMAKAAGVEAIVEGWVDPEGDAAHTLTVAVRDAATGRQIDTVSVKISDHGVINNDQTLKLSHQLDDILDWVDTAEPRADPPRAIIWIQGAWIVLNPNRFDDDN